MNLNREEIRKVTLETRTCNKKNDSIFIKKPTITYKMNRNIEGIRIVNF